jgi:hypothetical protein
VLVRRIAGAVHQTSLLVERGGFLDPVAEPRLLERVAMEFRDAGGDLLTALPADFRGNAVMGDDHGPSSGCGAPGMGAEHLSESG